MKRGRFVFLNAPLLSSQESHLVFTFPTPYRMTPTYSVPQNIYGTGELFLSL